MRSTELLQYYCIGTYCGCHHVTPQKSFYVGSIHEFQIVRHESWYLHGSTIGRQYFLYRRRCYCRRWYGSRDVNIATSSTDDLISLFPRPCCYCFFVVNVDNWLTHWSSVSEEASTTIHSIGVAAQEWSRLQCRQRAYSTGLQGLQLRLKQDQTDCCGGLVYVFSTSTGRWISSSCFNNTISNHYHHGGRK